MATKYTVKKGDTLTWIAKNYKTTVDNLVKWNDIANRDLIYVGQVITVDGPNDSPAKTGSLVTATVTAFGLQSNTDSTLFATWNWDRQNTENYQVTWTYDTGDGVWFIGSDSTTTSKQVTYSFPDNAKRVRFRVKPVSKKHKVNNVDTSYWTASWSTYKIFNTKDVPPEKPGTPKVEINNVTLTASLDNVDAETPTIEFQIVRDDKSLFKTAKTSVKMASTSYSCTVTIGCEYKVRCRAVRGNLYSNWSDYSDNQGTKPSAPAKFTTCKTIEIDGDLAAYLGWSEVKTATGYEIEHTTDKRLFDESSLTTKITIDGKENNFWHVTGLETGKEHFFRIRAVGKDGSSDWTAIRSVVIGSTPAVPTTWSSVATAITGQPINLYWVHNSEDNSSMTYANLVLTVGGVTREYLINATESYSKDNVTYIPPEDVDDETIVTSSVTLDTSIYSEGAVIEWSVATAGITKELSKQSVPRSINVNAPATMDLNITDGNSNVLETITSFPFYIEAVTAPATQTPIGYHLTVTSNSMYETVDDVGNTKVVSVGDQVYSKYFDVTSELKVMFSPGNIDLENNVEYTVSCIASMNSGLTAEASTPFNVAWTDVSYTPNAEISIDKETLVAYIHPYCSEYTISCYEVYYDRKNKVYSPQPGAEVRSPDDIWESTIVEGGYTKNGDQVYTGKIDVGTDGDTVFETITYITFQSSTPIEGVTLAVYRREFDGSFTEIASGLSNRTGIFVTDPHPSLDFARYRIIATDDATGAVSYYDVPGYPVGGKAIIIQWDEDWSSFDSYNEDSLDEPAWGGSMLVLPYNVDVSNNYSPDVSRIEYAGRKHPVAYYGTHVGETASWSTTIPKSDKETLYGLRRLANWMGDVYVREPSGSGYWANITVGFSQKHRDLTIPITLDITRVEGGM